jgi:hypothetical protein
MSRGDSARPPATAAPASRTRAFHPGPLSESRRYLAGAGATTGRKRPVGVSRARGRPPRSRPCTRCSSADNVHGEYASWDKTVTEVVRHQLLSIVLVRRPNRRAVQPQCPAAEPRSYPSHPAAERDACLRSSCRIGRRPRARHQSRRSSRKSRERHASRRSGVRARQCTRIARRRRRRRVRSRRFLPCAAVTMCLAARARRVCRRVALHSGAICTLQTPSAVLLCTAPASSTTPTRRVCGARPAQR